MCPKWRSVFYLPVFLLAILFHPSCSSGPRAPEKGTPAFYWQAAQERFAAGDYRKTNDHLDQLLKTDNEYTSRAQAWRLVLLTGMTASHMELADSFENGARANKANPVPFRKYSSDFRNQANRLALQKAETFLDFQKKNKDSEIWLDYGFPTGSAAPIMQLTKASTGILMATDEVETAQRRAVERGVLMATCCAFGLRCSPKRWKCSKVAGERPRAHLYGHWQIRFTTKQKCMLPGSWISPTARMRSASWRWMP